MVAYEGHDDRRLVVQLSSRIVSKLVILSDDLSIMIWNYKLLFIIILHVEAVTVCKFSLLLTRQMNNFS